MPAEPAQGPVSVRFSVFEYTALETPPGLLVTACATDDLACENPLAQDDAPDADGMFELELPQADNVYFRLQAPDTVETRAFTNQTLGEQTTLSDLVVVMTSTFRNLSTIVGTGDATKGAVIIEASECDRAAPGVHFELENPTGTERPFYFAGTVPDKRLTETMITRDLSPTKVPRAVGGYVDLEEGELTIHATREGMDFGSITAHARSMTLTLALLHRMQ
jgi:hypothetical protein